MKKNTNVLRHLNKYISFFHCLLLKKNYIENRWTALFIMKIFFSFTYYA